MNITINTVRGTHIIDLFDVDMHQVGSVDHASGLSKWEAMVAAFAVAVEAARRNNLDKVNIQVPATFKSALKWAAVRSKSDFCQRYRRYIRNSKVQVTLEYV